MAGQVEGDDPDRGDHGVQRASSPDQRLRRARPGGATSAVVRRRMLTAAKAATTRNTERQPNRSTSAPATNGPAIDGTTQAVANNEKMRRAQVRPGRRRPTATYSAVRAAPPPRPCSSRPPTRTSIEPANPETSRPATKPRPPSGHGQAGAAGVAPDAADDHPDDRRGEHADDGDRVERLAAEIPRHARHRQADRDRLEREHRDQREQTDRDGAVLLVEGARRSVGPGHGHGRQSTTSSMVEVKWITPSC